MSAITLGVRFSGGTKRVQVSPTATLLALKQQISKETGEPLKDMKLYSTQRKEFVGDSSPINKLGINNQDLVIVDVPMAAGPAVVAAAAPVSAPTTPSTVSTPTAAAAPTTAPAVKTCACKGTQRCLQCLPPAVDTGYGDRGGAAAPLTADPTDFRSALCKHEKGFRCVNCRPLDGATGKGPLKFLCQHGPGQKCINCLGVSREQVMAEVKAVTEKVADAKPLPCQHGPGIKCINCMGKVEVDVYDTDDDPRKHCRHHGPHGSCPECLALLEAKKPTIHSQEVGVCKRVDIARGAARSFGAYALETAFSVQRAGILYGTFAADGVTKAEVIYEPPQRGSADWVELLPDPDAKRIDDLAAAFGWQRVGWVLSHGVREIHMTSREVVQAAAIQRDCGAQAVTLVCLPEGMGQFRFEAYQVSNQAEQLLSRGWFADLEAQKQPDALALAAGRTVNLLGRTVSLVPTLYMVVNVAITQQNDSIRSEFAVENRPRGQTLDDYVRFVNKNKTRPFVERVDDFHVLLFLSNLLSPQDAKSLVEAVKTRNAGRAEGFRYVIGDLLGITD